MSLKEIEKGLSMKLKGLKRWDNMFSKIIDVFSEYSSEVDKNKSFELGPEEKLVRVTDSGNSYALESAIDPREVYSLTDIFCPQN